MLPRVLQFQGSLKFPRGFLVLTLGLERLGKQDVRLGIIRRQGNNLGQFALRFPIAVLRQKFLPLCQVRVNMLLAEKQSARRCSMALCKVNSSKRKARPS